MSGPILGKQINFSVKIGKTFSTSKLEKHLRIYHQPEYNGILEAKHNNKSQQTSIKAFATVDKYNSKYHQATIEFVLLSGMPFSIVNCPHFNKFLRTLKPDLAYKIHRQTLATKVSDLAYIAKLRMKSFLAGHICCLTTDGWTSQSQGLHYIAVTAHYIDQGWKLKSLVLACRHHSGSATAEDHRHFILDIMKEYGIENKNVSAIVTDTENTMSSFGKLMETHDKINWVGCLDHRLQICTKLAYKLDVMTRVRSLIGAVNHSPQSSEAIENYQKVDDPTCKPVGLLQECPTRWWSTYTTIERMLRLRRHIEKAILDKQIHSGYELQPHDWSELNDMMTVLKPFKLVQQLMEGQRYVTGSFTPAAIEHLHMKLIQVTELENLRATVRDLAKSILEKFNDEFLPRNNYSGEYFKLNSTLRKGRRPGISVELLLATALDPRFKSLLGIPDGEDRKNVWDEIKSRCLQNSEHPVVTNVRVTQTLATAAVADSNIDTFAAWYAGASQADRNVDDQSRTENELSPQDALNIDIDKEISCYRKEPLLEMFGDDGVTYKDPLSWWEKKEKEYRHLSKLAAKILCIMATSAPSERLFSIAGITISNDRSRMLPEVSESAIVLRSNWESLGDLFN